MTEVTQVDIKAAEAFMEAHGWLCEEQWSDVHPSDQTTIAKQFAAHRSAADLAGYERGQRETVERIVAWLRGNVNGYPESAGYAHAVDAIEAGEWK